MHIHWLALVLVISFAVCEEDMHDHDSEYDDVEEEKYDEEDESIADFERYLADFVPHETYLFKIAPLAPQKIIVRAQPTSYAFRGLIHADYESEDRFLVNILKDGHISKNFENKRFCVFHIECLGANEFAFVIQSQRYIEVYLSFELVENIKPLDNDTSIHQITQRMSKVHDILNQQETEMDRLVGYTNTHINVITKHVQDAVSRIICETIVIIVTGIVSLWVLRREMRRGYELLV